MRKELTTFVDDAVLASVKELARAEGRRVEELVDEALSEMVAQRRGGQIRGEVVAAYLTSHERYSELYRKLAQ